MRIEATAYTPSAIYNAAEQTLEISGKCIPENALEFFEPITEFLAGMAHTNQPITLSIKLDYFNTSSSKKLYDVFHQLYKLKQQGNAVKVVWRYAKDDEDLMESGMDYQEMVDIPFELVPE
jgi:hypothetical protein